jgi:hypothetical protein
MPAHTDSLSLVWLVVAIGVSYFAARVVEVLVVVEYGCGKVFGVRTSPWVLPILRNACLILAGFDFLVALCSALASVAIDQEFWTPSHPSLPHVVSDLSSSGYLLLLHTFVLSYLAYASARYLKEHEMRRPAPKSSTEEIEKPTTPA